MKRTTALLLMVLLFVSSSHALTFESYLTVVELTDRDSSYTLESVFLTEKEVKELNLTLIPRVQNLKVIIDAHKKQCDLEERIGFSFLRCSFPEGLSGKHSITITFESNYPLLKVGDKFLFKSGYTPTATTKEFRYLVKLPVGYIIPEEGKDISFFISPKPANVYSDGQRIVLLWEEKNVVKKFELSVFYKRATASTNTFLISVVVILILLVMIGFFLFVRRKKAVSPALLEKEHKVIEALKKAKNHELWQKQLQLETSFSKAKLSRTLRDLESRGMIKKEPFGNTNKICLAAHKKHQEIMVESEKSPE